ALHRVMQEVNQETSAQRKRLALKMKTLAHSSAMCATKCLPAKGPLALILVHTQYNRILPGWNGCCLKIGTKIQKILKTLKMIKLIKNFKRKSDNGNKISLIFFLELATSISSVSMKPFQDSSNGSTKLTLACPSRSIQLSVCIICASKTRTRTIAQHIRARRIISVQTLR